MLKFLQYNNNCLFRYQATSTFDKASRNNNWFRDQQYYRHDLPMCAAENNYFRCHKEHKKNYQQN